MNEQDQPTIVKFTDMIGKHTVVSETKSGLTDGKVTINHIYNGITIGNLTSLAHQESIRKVAISLRNDEDFRKKAVEAGEKGLDVHVRLFVPKSIRVVKEDISKLSVADLFERLTPEQLAQLTEKK